MKLTRKREIKLIEFGMKQILSKYFETDLPKGKPKKAKSIPKSEAKPHWTQTVAGKKKMARSMRKMWQVRRAKNND